MLWYIFRILIMIMSALICGIHLTWFLWGNSSSDGSWTTVGFAAVVVIFILAIFGD